LKGLTPPPPAELTFKCVNDFIHSHGVQFEELQSLCLGLVTELEKLREEQSSNAIVLPSHGVMILCEKCGNKRCPHAKDKKYKCTNSNQPKQVPVLEKSRFIYD